MGPEDTLPFQTYEAAVSWLLEHRGERGRTQCLRVGDRTFDGDYIRAELGRIDSARAAVSQ